MVKSAGEKTSPGSIRALNLPGPAEVEEDGLQRPVSIALRRRRLKVSSIDDVWEIADEWWRSSPIARRYCKVVLEDGTGLTVFRDLLSGRWYRQRE
jgi:hypothetical protein